MGHLVGRICYEKAEEATNAVMTQVVPTIDKDGVLHHPVFDGTTWKYNEQVVSLTFPVCDSQEYYNQGKQIGQMLLLPFIGLLIVAIVLKTIKTVEKENE